MKPFAVLALVSTLFTACATSSVALQPLAVLRSPDLALLVQPIVGSLSAEATESTTANGAATDRAIEIWLYSVEPRVIESISMRGTSFVNAATCSAGDVERWLDALRARGDLELAPLGDRPTLMLGGDARSFVSMVNQTAFVSGFEIQLQGNAGIADPRIDVISEGLLLEVQSERASGEASADVSVDLTLCELDRPFQERVVSLGTPRTPVTVQNPTGVTWKLWVRERLAGDEVLVLTGRSEPGDDDERAVLALVRFAPPIPVLDPDSQAR